MSELILQLVQCIFSAVLGQFLALLRDDSPQGSFRAVSGQFQGNSRQIPVLLQFIFRAVSVHFQYSFRAVLGQFQGNSRAIPVQFHCSFMVISVQFQSNSSVALVQL